MTISQQIVQSLRPETRVSDKEEENEIFDLDEHLRSSSKKVLLQRISFIEARQPFHFNLKKLKSKYVLLNPSHSSDSSTMSPALKANVSTCVSKEVSHDGIPPPKTVLFSPDKIELSWKRTMRAGAGLSNLGNTCFLNSSLQCLAYTAPLANYLLHLDHRKHCHLNGQFCMLCAMQQHIYNIQANAGQAIKPMYILKNLRMIAKHLQFGRQEDAHEFIRYSVDAMQKSCLYGFPSKIDVHIKATTAIHQIFGGYLRSRVKCKQCKSVSDTYDPFLDLSLDINKQGCVDLQRCLEMFVRVEVLQGDNAYKCIQCKTTVQACKKFSIHRPPNVLMVQLKRFSNFMGNKINKELSYPSKLNIGPYMSNKPEGGLWYELYAVLVHSGFSCQSGHYYAYAKAPNGQWYCFNDSSVHQVSVNQVLNQQAYLLFYSRNPKTNTQFGNFKQYKKSGLLNGNKDNRTELSQRANARPIIGPQLPPNFKHRMDSTFQSTSSGSDMGTPVTKNFNQPKMLLSTSEVKSASSIHANRSPLQFTISPKPKIQPADMNSKLANGGSSLAHISKSGSFNVKYAECKKFNEPEAKSTCSNKSWPSPILDKMLKTNRKDVASCSSSTYGTSPSNCASKFKPSLALMSLASYSSDEDDYDAVDDQSPTGRPSSSGSYTSIGSTLKELRQVTTEDAVKTSGDIAGTNTALIDASKAKNNDPTERKDPATSNSESTKITKSDCLNSFEKKESKEQQETGQQLLNSVSIENGICKEKPVGSQGAEIASRNLRKPEDERVKTLMSAAPPVIKSSPLRKLLSVSRETAQREPILDLLNSEINSANAIRNSKEKNCHPTDKHCTIKVRIEDIEKPHSLKDGNNEMCNKPRTYEDNSCTNGSNLSFESRQTGNKKQREQEYNEKNDRKRIFTEEKKEKHDRKKERKRQSSSESSWDKRGHFQPERGQYKGSRRGSPYSSTHEHLLASTKKRKREKSSKRHADKNGNNEDRTARKRHDQTLGSFSSGNTDTDSSNLSPKKKKKHNHQQFSNDEETVCKTDKQLESRSRVQDSPERSSSLEALYCESTKYDEVCRKKAKKIKKQRMRQRKMLQSSINETSSDEYAGDRTLSPESKKVVHGRKKHGCSSSDTEDALERKSLQNGGRENRVKQSPAKAKRHHENGNVYKWDQKRAEKPLNAPVKERPNILAQLLKQSSGKAYGTKVDTWNGGASVVERDAEETWREQRTPLVDEWDKEYDRGKTKKVKKKDSHEKNGRTHNLFQRFQNMKNQKHGI